MDSQPCPLYPAGYLEGSSGFKDVTAAPDSKKSLHTLVTAHAEHQAGL